jgi:hypothetical protein
MITFFFTLLFVKLGASEFSVAEPLTLWSKNKLKTCWILEDTKTQDLPIEIRKKISSAPKGSNLNFEEYQAVKNIIEENFKAENTGISFYGWNECQNDQADVYITTSQKQQPFIGFGSIGDGSHFTNVDVDLSTKHKEKSFVYLSRISQSKIQNKLKALQMFALHEFGHVAGLRHEHIRDEAKNDPNCLLSGAHTKEKKDLYTVELNEYDPNSIMNYCYIHLIHQKTGLHFYAKYFDSISQWNNQKKYWPENVLNFEDDSLYNKTTNENGTSEFKLNIQLSTKDKEGLRKLYPKRPSI